MNDGRWEFWIDRGGTFTDIVARDPAGALHTLKLLSEDPARYRDAAIAGIRRLLGVGADAPLGPARIRAVRMGTTVATNALLERRGERTLFVTTRGFRDALRIAYQNRPRLFDRRIVLPELLYERVIEARERIQADGTVIEALDAVRLREDLRAARADGLHSVAICFMHGWQYPVHESAAAQLARACGFTQVSVSHEVSPLIKFVSRGDTTVVDAYLSPLLARYVASLAAELPEVPLWFMQSSGGLCAAARFRGKDAVLSGPAGGIVGMARTALAAGHERIIGFDMGGTSTDVSHYAGSFERRFETQVAGVRLRAPMMHVHTIAAGGGSILAFDGMRLRVGPDSAGASPGPACYRRGGPLCVTDAQVLLGRIQPQFFPHLFGAQGDEPLDAQLVRERFTALAAEVGAATGRSPSPEALAEDCLQLAVQAMANAIKRISIERGYDVATYTLHCFGGAAGQHACRVADALGMRRVFIHPLAGVLSAYGMGLADRIEMRQVSLQRTLDEAGLSAAVASLEQLEREARAALLEQGALPGAIECATRVHLRCQGTDTALELDFEPSCDQLAAAFGAAWLRRFAFRPPQRPLLIDALSVEARVAGAALAPAREEPPARGASPARGAAPARVRMYVAGWREVPLLTGVRLGAGQLLDGPAILAGPHATTVIEPGWRARCGHDGALELERESACRAPAPGSIELDPMRLELFNGLFMNIAEQMGLQLQNTAHSVNIKERLDFSCALFDAQGRLVANAPHMPVHLGSMSESVRSIAARNPHMCPGDVYVLNDPYHGGTHLPDITVVTPVYLSPAALGPGTCGPAPAFYVASRGHHADVGGITPGSMPPFSRTIEEEGVRLDNVLLVRAGVLQEGALRERLCAVRWPVRNPEQTLADLRAQIAANERGAQELQALVARHGAAVVHAYMQHVQSHAAECVRRSLGRLRDGAFTVLMDNGARICVRVRVDHAQRRAAIDFEGTSPALANNFNAPRAVTVAAVLYVFRTLLEEDIPLNAGCLEPLLIRVPPHCMLDPQPPAAVVAGNVETSTCITNALYGALAIMASAQPTMNNLTFGNERHQYYETIAGGSGAGPGFAGTSCVQTHMTNSRLTDPEVLESRFPVRLELYCIRAGSGGAGLWSGGHGGVRRIRFLEPMTVAILSNGRIEPAFGLAGGAAGGPGINRLERTDGRTESLPSCATAQMAAGDCIVIETPGGGGYGEPSTHPS